MLAAATSAERWQAFLELRCRREVIERWLGSQVLGEELQHALRVMLWEIEDQLQGFTHS